MILGYFVGVLLVLAFNYCAGLVSDTVEVGTQDFDSFAKYTIDEQ
jgi:hypothetical protein